jgi:tRNA-2-methylthio-N6-dimethylallyladenosine synthase
MNVHDSERIAGLLLDAGYSQALEGTEPDLVVFNTCAVRENADNKLYGRLSFLAPIKKINPHFQIAVGGCMAQKDQESIIKRAPYVDVVFGTHNIGSLPALLERSRIEEESQMEIKESLEHFPSTLPSRRHSAFSAWVSISVGCNNTCTFCIVPSLRGVEKDRDEADILTEARALVDQGVVEITLLGQNVNDYKNGGFASLLRQVGSIDGLERLRFMSPHPRDFTDDVIEAMAETPSVMPHLHMPLQSGSDSILQAMRRSYRRERYMGIIERVRKAIPDAGITTDIIVGFPGETETDFVQTLEVVEEARFTAAFSFQYSRRPGTPAATMPDQIDDEVMADRYQRLHKLQQRISGEINTESVNKSFELLITDKSDARTPDFRLVHLPADTQARPGDIVTAKIATATPNYMIAGEIEKVRKTRGGDAHEARIAEIGPEPIMIGMPSLQKLKLIHGS